MTRRLSILSLVLLFPLFCGEARAQLANGFYNITAIESKALRNGAQVTVRTDGAVHFGFDRAELVNNGDDNSPTPVTAFRLRLYGARARIPAFQDIGIYPVDSVRVTLATDALTSPTNGGPDPQVDLQLRFYVPVTVRDYRSNARTEEWDRGPSLGPREVSVGPGPDGASIVITVISDRVDAGRAAFLRRSRPEEQHHRLNIKKIADGKLRIDVLHEPLRDVLQALTDAGGPICSVDEGVASTDVTVFLPSVEPDVAAREIARGHALSATPAEGGGMTIGGPGVTTRLPVRNMTPEAARLMFPDFLLPSLRADSGTNALVVTADQAVTDRVAADLALIDQPRPQVRVEASVYEIFTSEALTSALQLVRGIGRDRETIDLGQSTMNVALGDNATHELSAHLSALVSRGEARLAARPGIVVASGASGTLFMGQKRTLQVLRQRNGRQQVDTLPVLIGYSLTVRPTVGATNDILLDVNPKISTIDALEPGTGLPTVGIRETTSVVHLQDGDTLLLAGMETLSDEKTRRGPRGLEPPDNARGRSTLLVLLTARKASS